MSTAHELNGILAPTAFHSTSSRATAPVHSRRRLIRAAWLTGVLGLLALALAFSGRAPTALAAPKSAASGGAPNAQQMEVTSDTLNLRSGPGVSWPIRDVLQRGAIVDVISGPIEEDGFHWYRVSYHGEEGYMAGEYLSSSTDGGQCSPGCGLTAGGYAQVTARYLNLRCGPSINCEIIMSLQRGAVVQVLDGPTSADGYTWWHVSSNDQKGYMAGEFLAPANGPGPGPQPCSSSCGLAVGGNATVTSATLNLRSGPGLNCPINVVMSRDAVVKVLDNPTQADGYDWYKVSYNGQVGYAAGAYLTATSGNGCQTTCGGPHAGEDAWVRDTPMLHLRTAAGLSCDVETDMHEGAKVHIMDGPTHVDDYDWWHVTYTDSSGHDWDGYAAGDWLMTSSN